MEINQIAKDKTVEEEKGWDMDPHLQLNYLKINKTIKFNLKVQHGHYQPLGIFCNKLNQLKVNAKELRKTCDKRLRMKMN